jgi:hypothetical protein
MAICARIVADTGINALELVRRTMLRIAALRAGSPVLPRCRGLAGAEVALARKARHEAAEHRRDLGVAGETARQAAPAWHRRHQRLIDRPA